MGLRRVLVNVNNWLSYAGNHRQKSAVHSVTQSRDVESRREVHSISQHSLINRTNNYSSVFERTQETVSHIGISNFLHSTLLRKKNKPSSTMRNWQIQRSTGKLN